MGSVRVETDSGTVRYLECKKLRLLGDDELARLRARHVKSLFRRKKLCMVLDLDHTLLHSASEGEQRVPNPADDIFPLVPRIVTKLRPSVREFLKEASTMFEMYIYTMGSSEYAAAAAKLLDPTGEYFDTRIISRDDVDVVTGLKSLDFVLAQDRSVVILDDTEAVWSRHKDNLVVIERYTYFGSGQRGVSGGDDILTTVLRALKRVHCKFFNHGDPGDDKDVRRVLKLERCRILEGCKIAFSGVFPLDFKSETHGLWRMAEGLGAQCVKVVDPSVTHVVAANSETQKAWWARYENKFLVNWKWIEAANFQWKRLPEKNFPVYPPKYPT
uniref:RNA polymerase II C-terminal domain phosphatase-like n=1 Tax=Kalanchoe fedtschenkoi TaxID=63787 RepID=A0A7N0T5E8_KALFE